jgi:hypothetical protein
MSTDTDGPGAGPVNSAVLQAFEPYIDALAERLAERLERRRGRMINQHDSELGPRRHRDAVKRRIANGEGGAGRAGRDYLLTREAMREELAGKGGRGKPSSGAPAPAAPPSGDGPPTGGSAGKSRSRDLSNFEREVMSGLRAVEETGP